MGLDVELLVDEDDIDDEDIVSFPSVALVDPPVQSANWAQSQLACPSEHMESMIAVCRVRKKGSFFRPLRDATEQARTWLKPEKTHCLVRQIECMFP